MTSSVGEYGEIYDNTHYFIRIGESLLDDSKVPCYQVINKDTGINEAETTILPQAILHAKQFSQGLDEENTIAIPDTVITH